MSGAADPMMSFPAGTTFAPYSITRNIADQPIRVSPTLWWMEAGTPRSAPLHSLTVSPGQTQNLNLPALLASSGLKDFNGSVNLVLDLQGPPRGLLMASGSVDQKNTYVFGVVASGTHEGIAKSLSYWSTANGDDTMITLWNPADEAQDFVLTLFFTGGHYDFPIHLGPRATNMFNVSEIVHSQIPDAEGNVVPTSVHEGSARIAGTHGPADHILVAMAAGTYNVVKATCGEHCESCDGLESEDLEDIPVEISVGGTNSLKFIVQLKDGTQHDFTASSTWKTSNASIANVQSAGVIKGVAPGAFTTSATGPDEPVGSQCCSLSGGCSCPSVPTFAGGGGAVEPVITGVTPAQFVIGDPPSTMSISGFGFSAFPGTPTVQFDGTGITTSGANVINDGDIFADYAVSSSTAAGTQNVTVSFPGSDGGAAVVSNPWPVAVV